MNGKRIPLLTPKTGGFASIFQYFLDERAYWNAPFLCSPSSGDPLFVIFDKIISHLLSFVKKKRLRVCGCIGGERWCGGFRVSRAAEEE